MPKLTKKDERSLAAARQHMERYQIALSVLAQEDNSSYVTDEFRKRLAEAKERLAPYTIAGRAKT
ncbi:MAG: hypothetical protein L0I29_09000 [Hyphomicrobiales bacterium]|nr:hypothetical protein [Hyphomicrobiales bacterium]